MTATAELRSAGFVDLACPRCGWRFFTMPGLAEHKDTCHYQEVLRRTGLHVTAVNNARRVRCDECGKVSTPSGIGLHQRSTGHTGKAERT